MQSSTLLLVYYSLRAYMRSFWLLKSREMCQHMTGSGRCPPHPNWHKRLPVFAFTRSPNPSQHLSIHASIFCSSPFFLAISSPVSPSWVPRPFAWPCLTFPSSVYSHIYTHFSVSYHTLTGLNTCRVWRQTTHVLGITESKQLFPFKRQTYGCPLQPYALGNLAQRRVVM